jgi:branched-chain amino acid transport system substrate-binding protein
LYLRSNFAYLVEEEYMAKRAIQVLGGMALLPFIATSVTPVAQAAQKAHANIVVRIGVSVPYNEYPDLPEGIEYGVRIAVAEANAANLVPGVTFDVLKKDDTINNKHDPVKDASNARAFIADPSVIAEVGPLNSSAAQGSMPVYNNAQMVQISPANTNPDLTNPKFRTKYEPRTAAGHGPITYFRTCTTDAYQGPEAALYAYKTLGARRAYVTDNTGAYGVGLASAFAAEFKKLGGTVVGTGETDSTQPKLGTDALAANIASASGGKLDLVYFGGEFGATGGAEYLADALKSHGLNVKFMGGDGIFDQHFISNSSNGGVLNGYATSVGPYAATYPAAKNFLAEEAKMFKGFKVSVYDIESYDAAKAILNAYAKGVQAKKFAAGARMNSTTRGILAVLVGQTHNLAGASGVFSFDANGDTTNRIISVYKVNGTTLKNATWTYASVAPQL